MSDWHNEMIDEIEVRNLDEKTKRAYLNSMEFFVKFHGKDPVDLEIPDIKKYQLYMIQEKKYAPSTISRHIVGIRFYYRYVLGRHWYADSLPRVKVNRRAPVVLSEKEIALMIDSVHKVFYKAVIMVMYSAGLRNSEVRNLKATDIDSSRMVIHVRCGKGGRDRQALLSPLVLKCLRTYWRLYRVHNKVKSEWLFIPTKSPSTGLDKPLSHTALGYILTTAAKAAGIKKKFTLIY